ncbi:MAG TPA: DUF5947 family protein [Candidatus Eisenbacteria bacterium]|nr:DUF5947 family protein [Candidatus Eisenbacteria bacterium]
MNSEGSQNTVQAFGALRQLTRRQPRRMERCELCSVALYSEHPHLIEPSQRRLLCACDACALLFSGREDAKFKLVPRRVRKLSSFHMSDADWDGLLIPINLAYFVRGGADGRMSAMYPSPAGATESLLSLQTWNSIVQANPVLDELQPDVEALLVNRVGHARGAFPAEYYIAPIDACYCLVGLIRMHWRGLSGGEEVWREIGNFFTGLRSKAEVVAEEANA